MDGAGDWRHHVVAAGVGEDDPTRRARGRSVTASVAREILHLKKPLENPRMYGAF